MNRTARAAFGLVAALWVGTGCRSDAPAVDPALREPLVSFDRAALQAIAQPLAELEGTPLGQQAAALLEHLRQSPSCAADAPVSENLFAHATSGSLGADDFECAQPATPQAKALAEFAAERRGDHDGLVLWPIGDSGRLEVQIDREESGDLSVHGTVFPGEARGSAALLRPSPEPPAASALADGERIAHARLRAAGGLRLSEWLEAGGQADRLFALRGRLLEGALLRDTWEIAVLPPAEGGLRPMIVGALHHRLAGPIEAALGEALTQLESTWPIQRSPRTFLGKNGQAIAGECFLELPLLPELAPCWVVTETALVVGDQPRAVERALAGGASAPTKEASDASGLSVDFDQMRETDRRIAPARGAARWSDLWTHLRVDLRPAEDSEAIDLHARLEARS